MHIGGNLVETGSGGLALTVSGDKVLARTFSGGAADLDTLVVDAAQYVYSQFQPALWALHLVNAGRCPEAIAFIRSAYAGVTGLNRAMLLNAWANCVQEVDSSPASRHTALEMYREAIKADPDYMAPHVNEATELARSGDEEGAWQLMKGTGVPDAVKRLAAPVVLTNDFGALLGTLTSTLSSDRAANAPDIALLQVRLHDPIAAELTLQTIAASDDPLKTAALHFIRGEWDEELGDRTRAAAEMEAHDAALPDPAKRAAGAGMFTMFEGIDDDSCQIALIEEMAGHPDKADAILADQAAARFVDCQRFRGNVLDHRGDWAGAQQAYAQSVALRPGLTRRLLLLGRRAGAPR